MLINLSTSQVFFLLFVCIFTLDEVSPKNRVLCTQLQGYHSHCNSCELHCAPRDAPHIKHCVNGVPGVVQPGRKKALLISPSEAYTIYFIVSKRNVFNFKIRTFLPSQKKIQLPDYLVSPAPQLFPS